jgi:hypothetical protein
LATGNDPEDETSDEGLGGLEKVAYSVETRNVLWCSDEEGIISETMDVGPRTNVTKHKIRDHPHDLITSHL